MMYICFFSFSILSTVVLSVLITYYCTVHKDVYLKSIKLDLTLFVSVKWCWKRSQNVPPNLYEDWMVSKGATGVGLKQIVIFAIQVSFNSITELSIKCLCMQISWFYSHVGGYRLNTRTSAYHSQGNGQVEWFNRTVEVMLSKMVDENQNNWDSQLP